MLSPRQEQILRTVVDGYVETGKPVGSRWLSAQGDNFGPSTIRKEFAVLESHGLLTQPHTSAGRIPTEGGYRYYVNELLSERALPAKPPVELQLSLVRREVDQAMRATTEMLAEVTDLLSLVSAPSIEVESILRIEAFVLQPHKVMVVVITSAGGVTKRSFEFDRPVDPGLAEWATGYLNDVLKDTALGARMLRSRLFSPDLVATERAFIEVLSPAFLDHDDASPDTLYVGGASHLMTQARYLEMPRIDRLMSALEQRATFLHMLRSALSERDVYLRIGQENTSPELTGVSVVGANYGLPSRNLGTVSVVGPLRMDYPRAIASVRYAAAQLSDFVAGVYE